MLVPHGAFPLRNTGNYCFFNSVLQSLAAVRHFHSYVAASVSRAPLAGQLSVLLRGLTIVERQKRVEDAASAVLSNRTFPERFRSNEQQDAEELYRYLMNALDEELSNGSMQSLNSIKTGQGGGGQGIGGAPSPYAGLQSPSKWFNLSKGGGRRVHLFSPPRTLQRSKQNPFMGTLATCIKCTKCKTISDIKYSDFLDLTLFIPEGVRHTSLQDCLEHYTRTELVQDYMCSECNRGRNEEEQVRTPIYKRNLIGRAPKSLCLHLQRSILGPAGTRKVSTKISFPETLDVSQYLVSKHPDFFGSEKGFSYVPFVARISQAVSSSPVLGGDPSHHAPSNLRESPARSPTPPLTSCSKQYDLRAVVVHHGRSASNGHFTAYRKLLSLPSSSREMPAFVETLSQYPKAISQHIDGKQDSVWVKVSDENCVPVEKREVLNARAYMLFYEESGSRDSMMSASVVGGGAVH